MFLGRSVTQHKQVSDVTAHAIDEEVRRVIDDQLQRAPRRSCETNLDKLHAMAEALIKYETIDEEQIKDIMAGKAPQAAARLGRHADRPSPRRPGGAEGPAAGPLADPGRPALSALRRRVAGAARGPGRIAMPAPWSAALRYQDAGSDAPRWSWACSTSPPIPSPTAAAIARARRGARARPAPWPSEGAAIIDVGGESTRPGAAAGAASRRSSRASCR